MPQFTLEGLKGGVSAATHYMMRPQDFKEFSEDTKKNLQEMIEEQEIELLPFTFNLIPQKRTITLKIPNICIPVFQFLSVFLIDNQHLINPKPLSESISSLQKLYNQYPKNPDGWIIYPDKSVELTKLDIKQIIEMLDLSDSLDKIGGYSPEDYVFYEVIHTSEMIGERMFIESVYSTNEGKRGFLYLLKHSRPKKHIPCICRECGMLFLNQSHPAKVCERCRERNKESLKNRFCACGCGERLPEKYPQKKYYCKACVTRARRNRERHVTSSIPSSAG